MDAVDAHLTWMRDRGLSETTVVARRQALGRLGKLAPPATATREQVERHLAARRREVGVSAFRTEVSHLTAFYVWAARFDIRTDDPTRRVVKPRREPPEVQPIPDAALSEALTAATGPDLTILALAGFAGLRAMEIAALEWRDVNLPGRTITVRRGKGGKRRRVAVSDTLAVVLQGVPPGTGPVVPGPLTPNQVSKRASVVLGGRANGYTLHQLRHRFASAAYRGTLDLRAVQDALGHSSPTVTALYANPGAAASAAAADAAGALDPG